MIYQSTPSADAALVAFDHDNAIGAAARAVVTARRRAQEAESPRTVMAEALRVLADAGNDEPTSEQVVATMEGLAASAIVEGEQVAATKEAIIQALRRHEVAMAPVTSAITATIRELTERRERSIRERDSLKFRPPEGNVRDQLLRLPGFDPSHLQRLALPAEMPADKADDRYAELNAMALTTWNQLGVLQKIDLRRIDLDALQAVAAEHPRIARALEQVRIALGMAPATIEPEAA